MFIIIDNRYRQYLREYDTAHSASLWCLSQDNAKRFNTEDEARECATSIKLTKFEILSYPVRA